MCELNICRICLNMDVRGYKMDEYNLCSYYEEMMRYRLKPNDNLPQWFCYECATILHKYHKFKEKCTLGQLKLKQITWNGDITYESVAILNRHSEGLMSPVSVIMRNRHVKTICIKHKKKTKPKFVAVEKVMLNLDSEDSLKQEDLPIKDSSNSPDSSKINDKLVREKEKKLLIEKPLEKVDIKLEMAIPTTELLKVEEQVDETEVNDATGSINNTNDMTDKNKDIADINDDIDDTNDLANDELGNPMSSDDENIFLDIVKKAVNGENELVFLDNIDIGTKKIKKKKNTEGSRSKVQKFARPKKEYLNPQYWRKFSLNEEDAMHEFKQREHSDKYMNANYKCHNCLKGFSKIEMLMRHVKLRHDEACGPIECRFCHMRFRRKSQLCKHIKQHYSVYHCLRCDMRFRLESSAIFHEDYHNGVIRKCKHCGEEFKHSSTYYTHLRMNHRSAHLCTTCGASFVSDAGLQQHRRYKHFDSTDQESTEEASAVNTYCEKCDVKFASQAAYNEHLTHSNMHGDLTADSEVIRKNMKGNKRLMDLKEARKKKPTTCQYCGKHFSTQAACMKHHLAEHPRRTFYPPDQRHICEVCGVSLAAVSIASHMNRHTREHVYPCAVCGMQFISKSSHHRHQVTHTGERPYPCPLCEKRFTQKNSMQLHYRTFHLKQPYPKRNRKKKTDEMPIMESCRERSDIDSLDAPPVARWRPAL